MNRGKGKKGGKGKNSHLSKASSASTSSNKFDALTTWQCIYCDQTCEEDDEDGAIECFVCKQWAHRKCSKISKAMLDELGDSRQANLQWVCQPCLDDKKTVQDRTDTRLDKLMELLPLVKTISSRLETLEKQLSEENLEEKIREIVDKQIDDRLEEQMEIEKRKKNLIFVNVKESVRTEIEERQRDDLGKVREILGEVMKIEEADISNPVRLGKVGGNKPRYLRVTVVSEEKKWRILKKTKELNKNKDEKERKKWIYINPDYTTKQREENKALREEMRRRKEGGEKDLIIRKGKIVQLDPKEREERNKWSSPRQDSGGREEGHTVQSKH